MQILDIIFYSFIAVVSIQVIYYTFLFGRFAFKKPTIPKTQSIPISVIICAKNEAKNIEHFLPSILNQDYPNFEIVLINDSSTDETLNIMKRFALKHKNIKIVNVKNEGTFCGNKKQALTLGIKASTNQHLLFTDADCEAVSPQWISEMTAHFSLKKTLLLGYGGYFKVKGSFINKIIRYETLLTAVQYFSYVKIGLPYMGVGRNLAYHKDNFFKTNGFIKHKNIRSGDDDLFVNEVATSSNTEICYSPTSFTRSVPKTTWKTWKTQKRRHISTAKHYKIKHKFLLGLFYCSQFLFWLLALILLITPYHWEFVLLLILIRSLSMYTTLHASARKLKETDLTVVLPILELFLILSQFGIFMTNLIVKPKHWR